MIFESHAHYDDAVFDNDRDELLASLPEKGISYVINVSADVASIDKTVRLTKKYPYIYGALGVHPTESAALNDESFAHLKEECGTGHIKNKGKIVAVGEIGLDYYYDEPEPSIQKKWFRQQLELAIELNLPVIIHSRDAAKDTMDIMKEYQGSQLTGVFHCYSYSREIAAECMKMGFYFGIGGVITFKNAKKLKEVAAKLPLERILLETDSPYLAPVPNRGKRNSSLYLPEIAAGIAQVKGISYEEVVTQTCENSKRLFGIDC